MFAGTPSSRPATDRLQRRFPRSLQTPHTPRQTPRPTTKSKHEAIESVDLTGDDFGEIPVSRSSSSDVTYFGEPIVLWKEDSASRAEPLARSSRKRKSDEMSPKRLKKIDSIDVQLRKSSLDRHMSMEGFVDIDEMALSQTQPKVTAFDPSRAKSLRPLPSIEKDIPEEYEITETISRVETRTRKTISRVPSVTEGSGSRSNPPVLPIPKLNGSGQTPPKARDIVQVAASPVSKPVKPPGRSSQTPQRDQKRQIQRTIQDSDEDEENDEEILSEVHKRASCSPSLSIKKSPRVIEGSTSPKRLDVSPFEAADIKMKDLRDSKPRIGSPLRPISRNVAVRQEKIPSPFQRDSPTKMSLLPEPPKEALSQHTPGSSLGLDEKKLVQLYLKQPSAVSVYQLRAKNSFNQNSIACMEYIDNEKDAPAHLKEERKTLLDMKNAYEALESLSERHRNLSMEKKSLYRKISELMELELDAGPQEERQLNLTQEIRKIEKEIGQFLHVSGAVSDGFGTESQSEAIAKDIQRSSLRPENSAPLPSGSSTVGSAQIIWQTQIPHAHQQSVMRNNQHDCENVPANSSLISDLGTSDGHQYRASPSPVRQPAPAGSFIEQGQSIRRRDNWTSPGKSLKQPNFYVDRSPIDYGFEGDDLDDLLRDEEELHQSLKVKQTVPEDIEDNYGDSDDDNDMLEIAQEVEKRQSLPGPAAIVPPRRPASDTSKSRSTSGKRTMYSHVDPALANMLNFPWSADVKKALRERFGLRGFRQNQLEAINATLSGKDAFILMPTGGGKSLCYQLPAIVQSGKTRGVTIVISPLLSLMNDQVNHLQKLHIQAFLVNGEKAQEERNLVYNALRGPYPDQFIQLLYITPEMIGKSDALLNVLAGLHEKKKLARIVVDEAHCVSQWGHDFRPDYKTISKVRMKFPGVPLIALTATATENVKADCIHNLGMEGCEEYKQSFNRPNLYYEIQPKKGKGATAEVLEKIASLIKNDYKNQTGIVYTLSRAGCEELAEKLRDRGIKAYHFHASMPPEEKNSTQRDWQSGKLQVVVATIAFGMGIDKPDVRFVIHHTLPKSLEGYYQETGRAGRDGKLSKCILFYGYQDTSVLKRFIDENEAASEDVKERQREMLTRMIQYCENRTDCRRADILSYFGESFAKEDCNHTCDNCNSDAMFEQQDMTNHATAALNMVKKLSSRNVTMVQVNDLLRGLNHAKTKDYHDVEGFGVARDLPKVEVQRLLTRLVMEGALEEYHVVNKSSFASQYIQVSLIYSEREVC
jgi:bloom syndrome protein